MSPLGQAAPAVRKETRNVALYTGVGLVLMLIVFGVLHAYMPDKIPFGFPVVLSGVIGACVAVLNFYLMGLTVQKVAAADDEQMARNLMKASYSRRMAMQMLWVVLAICLPCFQFAAGLIPLLFPSMGIKLVGILKPEINS